jgi:S1-C subfamily serine protease
VRPRPAAPAPSAPVPSPFGAPPPGTPPRFGGGGYPDEPPLPPYIPPREPDGRLGAALIGALVGALVAALIAGLVVAVNDDGSSRASAPPTTGEVPLDIQRLLDAAEPSVVAIESSSSAGSGFVISANGLIVTNDHVISGASELDVVFVDGTTADAELVGSFPDDDVAMIRVKKRHDLVPARLGSSDALHVGDSVVAIGNALGLGVEPSVTLGIVSAKDRSIETEDGLREHLIQTDAAINPGNSGGPLVNARGEVVGINTANIPGAQNIGFALSIDAVKPLIAKLRAGRGEINANTGFLGVESLAVDDPRVLPSLLTTYEVDRDSGAFVLEVTPDSAAEQAGLERGDVIIEADGVEIRDSDDVAKVIRNHVAGERISVTYERRGVPHTIEVTLGRR